MSFRDVSVMDKIDPSRW